jgi:hypothetical protein
MRSWFRGVSVVAAAGLVAGLLSVVLVAAPASATTTYSDYVVFGAHGVFIGAGSTVIGMVGAANNNAGTYPSQPDEALGLNGGAEITGDSRVGGDVDMANSTALDSELYREGSLTIGSGSTIGGAALSAGTYPGASPNAHDHFVADADLPSQTLLQQSVWPGGLGSNCPTGGPDESFASNGQSITLTPGNWGEVKAGSTSTLTFNGAGNYFINRIQFGGGLTIKATPGAHVFVCGDVTLAGGTTAPLAPAVSLTPGQFTWEVAGIGVTAGTNAFTGTGFNWIGNVLVPTRGIHFGTGGGGAMWLGYMWGDHVDIEHGVITTKPPKKSGIKFNDVNGDGIYEPLAGETTLTGWTIYVDYNDNGQLDAGEPSAVTGVGGFYEITDITPGTWKVREVQQAGWTCTFPTTNDAKPDVAGGCYHQETFANGDDLNNNDFGNRVLFSPPNKSGVKFDDLNGNGQKDAGEPGINGWGIDLYLSPDFVNPAAQTTTATINNVDGAYVFTSLAAGDYRVCEEGPPQGYAGYVQTTPNSSTPSPNGQGETTTDQCPAPNNWGYEFTAQSGVNLVDNDFGNWKPPTKTGQKWVDNNADGIKDGADAGIQNWTIKALDPNNNNAEVVSTTTDQNGNYTLNFPKAGTFIVCEVAQTGWTQTFPNTVTNTPPDSVTDTCPTPTYGKYGYLVTVQSGTALSNDDFGNEPPPVTCQKPTMIDRMNLVYPNNKGPDITVRTWLNESIQSAVDNATDLNNDGYIIVVVIANSSGALGGSANQSVVVSHNYGSDKPFGLFGCSVTLTGGGAGPAISVSPTATAKLWSTGLGGRSTNIFVMDLHGSNSAIGAQIDSSNGFTRYLDNSCNGTCGKGANGVGIKVIGNNNTVHNGEGTGNTGDGVQVYGNGNLLDTTDAIGNGGNGFTIVGNNNLLQMRKAGDTKKGNGGAGVYVNGTGNQLTQITAIYNTGPGFWVTGGTSGTGANAFVKNNSAQYQTTDYKLNGYVKNTSGGNKAEGVVVPKTTSPTKCVGTFPAQGATTNFSNATCT